MGETLAKNSRALVVVWPFGQLFSALDAVVGHQLMDCRRNFNTAWRSNLCPIETGKSGKSVGRSIFRERSKSAGFRLEWEAILAFR